MNGNQTLRAFKPETGIYSQQHFIGPYLHVQTREVDSKR